MTRQTGLPLHMREPTSKLTLETKAGKVQYDNIDQIVVFLLNNPVDWFAVYRNGKEITNLVQPILDYKRK